MYTSVGLLLYAALAMASVVSRSSGCSSVAAQQVLTNGYVCTATCGADRAGGDYGNAYVGSYQACLKACGSDPKCVTAQYHVDNGYCYFKNSVNQLISSTTTDTVDCCPGVFTASNGDICTPTCGQDRPGGDYNNTYTGTFDGCIKACGADTSCLTAQFSQANGYCYFKNSYHAYSNNIKIDTVDCCPGPKTYTIVRTCTSTCLQDRPGGDYSNLYAGSRQACIDACGADPSCKSAQYRISNGYCYLKNSTNTAVASLDTDSIVCA